MSLRTPDAPQPGRAPAAPPPMTPERWRVVDAIVQAALAGEPARREAFVADACGDDAALRGEVASLLAAHDGADDFLERPAAEALGVATRGTGTTAAGAALADRLTAALAGRYVLQGEIGQGGMAVVWRAHDLRHGRTVAIKVLRPEFAAAVGAGRFVEEVRVTASLQHPHVLPLFDSGSADGLPWYVMPFVEGETLRARLAREGCLPVHEAVRLAREIADALDHAHVRGIVHRDVKPENVLLQDGRALVADFGIALALEEAGGERLTRTGLTLGTPQYMAPEQAAGARVLDARVDVHALGVVLHEMLTGEAPYAAATRQAVVQRLLLEPPPALTLRRPDVPPALEAVVRRALAKRPDERFPTAAAFADALVAAVDGPPAAARRPYADPSPTPTGRLVSARGAVYAATACFVLGLAGGWALAGAPLPASWRGSPAAAADVAAGAPAIGGAAMTTPEAAADAPLVVLDRAGRLVRAIPAARPWTPRFSPDGRWVAYGAFGDGRTSSDLWATDLEAGVTRRLTDDDRDSNDPQWSPDGTRLAFSLGTEGGKDIAVVPLAGGPVAELATRDGTQFPSDWARDGRALLVTDQGGPNGYDILVQPADGRPARPWKATGAEELAARLSPDGGWVAYTSDASGQSEVYLDAFPEPGRRVAVSRRGGAHPVWRADGRELYYWRDGTLVAVTVQPGWGGAPPAIGAEVALFRAPYQMAPNTMYDVSPDGTRFVIVRAP